MNSHSDLKQRRLELLRELERLNALESSPPDEPARRAPRKTRSVRDLVLDALDELGTSCYSQQLVLYVKARFGRDIPAPRFGPLSVDEERAFGRGASRTVWLAHGITFDRAEPVKRLWGRSDWPLEARVVTPGFGRIQFLRITARLCELADQADELAADPNLLRYLAADHARDLGAAVKKGDFHLGEWKEMALTQLASAEPKEQPQIQAAAHQLTAVLNDSEMLFGRKQRPVLTAVPNEMQA